jgi:hypothetical protein
MAQALIPGDAMAASARAVDDRLQSEFMRVDAVF